MKTTSTKTPRRDLRRQFRDLGAQRRTWATLDEHLPHPEAFALVCNCRTPDDRHVAVDLDSNHHLVRGCDGCVATDYRQQRVRELDEQIAVVPT